MKIKKIYQVLAITVALSMAVPSDFYAVMAAGETEVTEHESGNVESEMETTALETTENETEESESEIKESETTAPESESETGVPETSESEPAESETSESETEIETDAAEIPSVVEPETETEIPPVVAPPEEAEETTESETEKVTEPAEIVKPPEEPEPEEETTEEESEETESETETETEEETEEDSMTNEELIALQKIVIPPAIEESFRFVTVEKDYAIVNVEHLQIYEEKSGDSRVVGNLGKGGLCFVLNDQDPSWYYVESGVVRGFVLLSDLMTGEEADRYVAEKKETNLALATASVEPMENSAFTYTKTTVRSTVVGKNYALCTGDDVNVREGQSEDSRVIGKLDTDNLCYVLAKGDGDWLFVESGSVRGFVKKNFLRTGEEVKAQILEAGENTFATAEEFISSGENKACYYTITSIKKGSISDSIRESMLKYALQFVGNSYVWGGTSLTAGADCSGFVQSIYSAYGYALPRVAEAQAQYGMQIPVSEAKPGDLIFYAKDGSVYHVVMYLGDGKTVEAANSNQGIICSEVDTVHAVWATRVISDSDSDIIEQVNDNAAKGVSYTKAKAGDSGESLGRFKLTAYCSCKKCCGQWAGGPTASGTIPVEGRTIAMAGLPFGTKLIIGGMIYTVEDRGTPYGHVDIYMNDHDTAESFGVQYAEVFLTSDALN